MKKVFFLLTIPFLLSINTIPTGFQITKSGGSTRIYAKDGTTQGACRIVTNTNVSNDIFVPTKSTTEWANFIAASKPTYITSTTCYPKSCKEIKDLFGTIADGTYTIDSDGVGANAAYSAYCDMTTDGGGWTRVFRHNVAGGYFTNAADALSKNIAAPTGNLYSVLDKLDNFKTNGKYRFRQTWPGYSQKNIWLQTTNPTADVNVAGTVPLMVNLYTDHWGGLEYGSGTHGPTNSNSSLLDGAVNHSNWWYAVGSYAVYNGGIPSDSTVGGSAFGVPETDLWIKDDDTYTAYNSCKAILDAGASQGSGYYTIDPGSIGTPIPVYCDMTTDGGGWTRVFSHTYSGGLFTSNAEALSVNSTSVGEPIPSKYSILSRIGSMYRNGKLEFKITWPGTSALRNWWTQTSNPTSQAAAGYVGVAIDSSSNYWAGLEYNGVDSFMDGSVGSPNWFYSIGAKTTWGTPAGIPASDTVAGSGIGVARVDLWVK